MADQILVSGVNAPGEAINGIYTERADGTWKQAAFSGLIELDDGVWYLSSAGTAYFEVDDVDGSVPENGWSAIPTAPGGGLTGTLSISTPTDYYLEFTATGTSNSPYFLFSSGSVTPYVNGVAQTELTSGVAGSVTAAIGNVVKYEITGTVTYCYLYNDDIFGDISQFAGLTSLTSLNLGDTSVSGDISDIDTLTSLTYLSLSSTSVSGDISGIATLTSLTYLRLSNTSVSGDISQFAGLTSLEYLYIYNTSVSATASAQTALAGLTSLTRLWCYSCGMTNAEVQWIIDGIYASRLDRAEGTVCEFKTRQTNAAIADEQHLKMHLLELYDGWTCEWDGDGNPPVIPYLDAADVRSGTYVGDGTTGTLVLPAASDVRDGTIYDATTEGTLDLPAESDVLEGVTFDGATQTGTATPPGTPTLTVTDNTDGSASAAVTGSGTITLYYRIFGASAWTTGTPRTGDGDITQTGLTQGSWYEFYATANDGLESAPSELVRVLATDPADTTAAGPVGKSTAAMRDLLAASATFQAAVGAEDAAAALASIHIGAYAPSGDVARPFALVHRPSSGSLRRTGTAATATGGQFKVLLERTISAAWTADAEQAAAQIEFENFVGQLIDDCMDLAATAGYLLVTEMEIIDGPFRYEAESIKDVMGCWLNVRYGING